MDEKSKVGQTEEFEDEPLLHLECAPHAGTCDMISIGIFDGDDEILSVELDPIEVMTLASDLVAMARDQIIKPRDGKEDEEESPEVVQ